MKKIFLAACLLIIFGIGFNSCGSKKGEGYVEIKNLLVYTDQIINFSIKYPDNWFSQKSDGFLFTAFSNKAVVPRFNNYDLEGESGAQIKIESKKFTDTYNYDSLKNYKKFPKNFYSEPEKVSVEGIDAVKQTYKFELSDGIFNGEIYYATKDNLVGTVITFEAFGGTFDKYKEKFAEILQSVKLAEISKPKADTITKIEKAPPPSSNLVIHKAGGYTMLVPDNFEDKNPPPVAGVRNSVNYLGQRRGDCNIQVDIIDASKQKNLDKIVQDNKPNYQNATPRQLTLGGEKAFMMNYSFRKDNLSRVYFVLKGDKLFRITMNWYKPEEADYLPIFEKCINSIKFE